MRLDKIKKKKKIKKNKKKKKNRERLEESIYFNYITSIISCHCP